MKAFVWEYVEGVSLNYHSGGGLVVVAPSLAAARTLIEAQVVAKLREDEPNTPYDDVTDAMTKPPDHEWLLASDQSPMVLVFENAGCC